MCNECKNKKEIKKNLIETHPNLIKYWDYEKNNKLGIKLENFTYGSEKIVWWKCLDCGKSYDLMIRNKIILNYNCPFCAGKRTCLENCLATLKPDIAEQWNPTKNKELTPFDVTPGCNKKVWWLCPDCNMPYDIIIYDRVNQNQNCPFCAGKRVCNWNCLETKFPKISKELHPTLNNEITGKDITPCSNKILIWLCPKCNMNYPGKPNERTNRNYGCPYCSGQKVCLWNCLATLRPDLALQWHHTKNETLTPFDVVCGSHKKVFWKCDKGHEWEAIINNRTKKNHATGCPECKIYYHEILCQEIMYEVFNKKFIKIKPKTLKNRNGHGLELDCYNEELKINIEYDGIQHYIYPNRLHKNKKQFKLQQQNDSDKDQWCIDNNILQIRVSYKYDTKEEIQNYIKEQLILNNKI